MGFGVRVRSYRIRLRVCLLRVRLCTPGFGLLIESKELSVRVLYLEPNFGLMQSDFGPWKSDSVIIVI